MVGVEPTLLLAPSQAAYHQALIPVNPEQQECHPDAIPPSGSARAPELAKTLALGFGPSQKTLARLSRPRAPKVPAGDLGWWKNWKRHGF